MTQFLFMYVKRKETQRMHMHMRARTANVCVSDTSSSASLSTIERFSELESLSAYVSAKMDSETKLVRLYNSSPNVLCASKTLTPLVLLIMSAATSSDSTAFELPLIEYTAAV